MTGTPRRALFALIVASTLLRLGWGAALEASNDEAYNYLYTVYPDWSQFDHPPATMLVEQFGLAVFGGTSPLALRFGFILIGAASTWVMARWTASRYGDWAGFYAALALNLTGYFMVKAAAFAQPDGPVVFFSLLTLWALDAALDGPPRVRPWLLVGLAWAGAMASKYTAIFLPAGAVAYILLTPGKRGQLLAPGPYVGVAIGLLGLLPVLVWNVNHGWASFAFQGNRAIGWMFRPGDGLNYLAEQAGQWLPWMWVILMTALFAGVRRFRSLPDTERHMICQAVIPLAFFFAVAVGRGALPHWAFAGFLPLYPFVGRKWAGAVAARPGPNRRWLAAAGAVMIAIIVVFAVHVRTGLMLGKGDFTRDVSGWESVGRELADRGLVGRPHTFAFTDRWSDSGHVAFELRNRMPVLCYNPVDARGFGYWTRPDQWIGWDGLLIDAEDHAWLPMAFATYFQKVELVAEFPMTRGGVPMRPVKVYLCIGQTRPYPFALPVASD